MLQVIVDLNISREQLVLYYQGSVQQVQAYATDGQLIRFPITVLRKFVSDVGVKGRFIIVYSLEGKFKSIARVL